VTDPRNRVTTDPGLGPVEREHASTLRSMTAADPVPDDEIPGAPVYYEPKPLHAVSEHKTLELETVKIARDIDPRKLPTELKLRRPVLHVLPASDPLWPAPAPLPLSLSESASPSLQYDSNWPPPETVLTTSQPPLSARRRSHLPLLLFLTLVTAVLLLLGVRAWSRSQLPGVAAQVVQPARVATVAAAPSPQHSEALPSEAPAAAADTTDASITAEAPAAVVSATAADSNASSLPAAHHPPSKLLPPNIPSTSPSTSPATIANSSALSAPPPAKPKRAIY